MGYSASEKAFRSLEELIKLLRGSNPPELWTSNEYVAPNGIRCFYEINRKREHYDGSITGTVNRFTGEHTCRSIGSFRINATGEIVRFPYASKALRRAAEANSGADRRGYDRDILI